MWTDGGGGGHGVIVAEQAITRLQAIEKAKGEKAQEEVEKAYVEEHTAMDDADEDHDADDDYEVPSARRRRLVAEAAEKRFFHHHQASVGAPLVGSPPVESQGVEEETPSPNTASLSFATTTAAASLLSSFSTSALAKEEEEKEKGEEGEEGKGGDRDLSGLRSREEVLLPLEGSVDDQDGGGEGKEEKAQLLSPSSLPHDWAVVEDLE
jgi:hypothetical protein